MQRQTLRLQKKINNVCEDSEHNFWDGANMVLDKDTDGSNLNSNANKYLGLAFR